MDLKICIMNLFLFTVLCLITSYNWLRYPHLFVFRWRCIQDAGPRGSASCFWKAIYFWLSSSVSRRISGAIFSRRVWSMRL